ncbi:MAG TPA: hypothetical protein VKZ68_01530 [Ohtaekwangia sp.]|nr:hypothetical protein [Ohtaekwangia sp.]
MFRADATFAWKRITYNAMLIRTENLSQQTYEKSDGKREKNASCKLASVRAGEKARKLLRSIMSDFPTDDEFFSHNFD